MFPHAILNGEAGGARTHIMLRKGEDTFLEVRQVGIAEDKQTAKYSMVHAIDLSDDITALGKFIHALICRYNALVTEANGVAEQSVVKALARIAHTGPLKQANGVASEWMG